jgi:alpha 1,3-glucosidase
MIHSNVILALFVLILVNFDFSSGVDRNNFKTCEQSGFCKRQRNYKPDISPYVVQSDTLKIQYGHLTAQVLNTKNSVLFVMDLYLLKDNRFRFRLNELNPLKKRYEVEDTIVDDLQQERLTIVKKDSNLVEMKSGHDSRVILYTTPLKLEFYIGDYLVVSYNSKSLLKFEHLRTRSEPAVEAPSEGEEQAETTTNEQQQEHQNNAEDDEPDMWEETFKTHTDSKPNGPESIGMDISFHDFEHVYGIPMHADKFSLKSTTNSDPFRLYNLDVFEYEVENGMALYGSIPYMIAHNTKFTVGLLWLNAAETWIDVSSNVADKNIFSKVAEFISKSNEIPQVDTHWMSESGVIDIYIMMGPKPSDVFRQYGALVGNAPLPPIFSIAYHQCRWNYNDQEDVKQVNAGFEEHQIPMDVMWLDIEHTNDKRYFTWDAQKFPDSLEMINNLSHFGRKLVTIVDPHIKSDSNYHIYSEAKDRDFFIKDKTGKVLDGWCWPGSSAWPDFLNAKVQEWWASKFLLDNYAGTTLDTFTWNDMNEPTVFNGPEITFHKDALHLNGLEHRHTHNMYGINHHKSTYMGHLQRSNGEQRPFVLTRSTFIGSQRYGAVWTGDNTAEWSHLKISIPMCLSFSVAGMSFVGADVGGFFKSPDAELMIRWYQAAVYQPFFRSHAHIDTKRREPWLFGDESTNLIRDAIHTRYTLLYYWYTLFYQNEMNGTPPMLPLWVEFPSETGLFGVDDQHMVGSAIMVKPITDAGATRVDVLFPGQDELWYDIKGLKMFEGGSTKTFTDVTLSTVPAFQRGGSIVPYKFRLRRSSKQMADDPFTLIVCLNKKGQATGQLYIDDTVSFNYQKNKEFIYREFHFENNSLKSNNLDLSSNYKTRSWLERVIIYGYDKQPKSVKIEHAGQSTSLEFTFDNDNKILLVRKPTVTMNLDWSILID